MQGNAVENLGVARGQRVEDEAGEGGRVGWILIQRSEATLYALRIDALRHSLGQQKVGVVYIQQAFGAGNEFGGGDQVNDGPDRSVERPLIGTLADEPHSVNVFVEADAVADGSEVGE